MTKVLMVVYFDHRSGESYSKEMEIPFAFVGMNMEFFVGPGVVDVKVSDGTWYGDASNNMVIEVILDQEQKEKYRPFFEADSSWAYDG